jgi:hypothetical protein
MARRPRRDIPIPPDNYSAADREWLKLLAIPARMEAEALIAQKFAERDMTGIFVGDPAPEIRAEALRQDKMWRDWEVEQSLPAPRRTGIFARVLELFIRRARSLV